MAADTVWALLFNSDSRIHLGYGSVGQDAPPTVTARRLAIGAAQLARTWSYQGLKPGDRVAVWAPNELAYLLVLAAASAGGFVVVSLNTRFSVAEAADIASRAGASLVVTDSDEFGQVSSIRVVSCAQIESVPFYCDSFAEAPLVAGDLPFVIFSTSGTTSKPKLVLHTQSSIAVHGYDVARFLGFDRSTRALVVLPLCGVFGLAGFIAALACGAEIWLAPTFDAQLAAQTVEQAKIETMSGSDDMFHRMLEARRRSTNRDDTTTRASDGFDLSSLTLACYAGFNPSLVDVAERADKRGIRMLGAYGMSEVQALFALAAPSLQAEVRKRAGGTVVSPKARIRIVDPDTGDICPDGEPGELQIIGPSLFAGYLREGGGGVDLDLTASGFAVDQAKASEDDSDTTGVVSNQWFKTGDLAVGRSDGSFEFLTRMGDVLRLGGFLVNPAEIEDVVLEVPGIVEAQVVAVARPEGVRPVAVVTVIGPVDEQAVIAHCRKRLARFKSPIRVLTIDEFPTTPSANGTKIQRNKLLEFATEQLMIEG